MKTWITPFGGVIAGLMKGPAVKIPFSLSLAATSPNKVDQGAPKKMRNHESVAVLCWVDAAM